jgi:hypothetical protein
MLLGAEIREDDYTTGDRNGAQISRSIHILQGVYKVKYANSYSVCKKADTVGNIAVVKHYCTNCLKNMLVCILTIPSPMSATSQWSTGVLPICANTMVQFSDKKTSCGGNILTGPTGKIALAFGFRGDTLLKAVAAVSLVLEPQEPVSLSTAPPPTW